MKKLTTLFLMTALLPLTTVARADWISYNDLYDGSGNTAALGLNVTTHEYLTASSSALMNFDTGASLPVTITGVIFNDGNTNGDVHLNGADTDMGTDAHNVFDGILDLNGVNELDQAGADEHKAIVFNGLDPTKTYTIDLTTNRDNVDYTDRGTTVTIEGADAFTYAASAGVTKLSEASGQFVTGYNTVNGYVMKWTGISPGVDGSFSIKSQNADLGAKGYAMAAFKLEEVSVVPEPSSVAIALFGSIALLCRRRR